MPTSEMDYATIEAARKKQAQSTRDYGKLTASSKTFADDVMERVRQARAERGVSRLATQTGEVSGQLASEGPKIRERLADVNPLQTDVITGRQTAQTLSSLGTLAQVGQEREGSITDILGAGTNQILARAAEKKTEAEAANVEADALMEMLKYQQSERKISSASSNSKALYEFIYGQGTNGQGVVGSAGGTGPQYTPTKGEGARDGNWTFSGGSWKEQTQSSQQDTQILDRMKTAKALAFADGDTESMTMIDKLMSDYKSTTKPLTTTQIVKTNLAKSGLRGLDWAEQTLGLRDENGNPIQNAKVNSKVLATNFFTGTLANRDYDSATFQATEAILRDRTGAASPEQEVRRYQVKLFPWIGDSDAVILRKLQERRADLTDILNQGSSAGEQLYLMGPDGVAVEADNMEEYQQLLGSGYTPL